MSASRVICWVISRLRAPYLLVVLADRPEAPAAWSADVSAGPWVRDRRLGGAGCSARESSVRPPLRILIITCNSREVSALERERTLQTPLFLLRAPGKKGLLQVRCDEVKVLSMLRSMTVATNG